MLCLFSVDKFCNKLFLVKIYRYSRFGGGCAIWNFWLQAAETFPDQCKQNTISYNAITEQKNSPGKEQEMESWPAWSSQDGAPGIVCRGSHNLEVISKLWTQHPSIATNDLSGASVLHHSLKVQSPWQEHVQMSQLLGNDCLL